ncbi:MAG: hypothetical protein ACLFTV_06600, partial [Desulfococcaceae bacterium]
PFHARPAAGVTRTAPQKVNPNALGAQPMYPTEEAPKEDELNMLLDDLRHGRSSEAQYRELMEKLTRKRARRRAIPGESAKEST